MNVIKIDRKLMRVLPSLDIWDDFLGVRYTVKTYQPWKLANINTKWTTSELITVKGEGDIEGQGQGESECKSYSECKGEIECKGESDCKGDTECQVGNNQDLDKLPTEKSKRCNPCWSVQKRWCNHDAGINRCIPVPQQFKDASIVCIYKRSLGVRSYSWPTNIYNLPKSSNCSSTQNANGKSVLGCDLVMACLNINPLYTLSMMINILYDK